MTGITQWLWQRLTAVIVGIYTLSLIFFFLLHPNLTYDAWFGLFRKPWVQIASLIFLLATMMHAWIGLNTVLSDYIKSVWLNLLMKSVIILVLSSYFIWGAMIFWG